MIKLGYLFIILFISCLAYAISINGCNRQIVDINYKFNTAYVKWPDGSVKTIKIAKWRDYDGEQIQIISEDGKVYLVSSVNAVLVKEY